MNRFADAGVQPTRTYGGTDPIPSGQTASVADSANSLPDTAMAASPVGSGVIRPMTLNPTNLANNQYRALPGSAGQPLARVAQDHSTGYGGNASLVQSNAQPSMNSAASAGTSGGYYGTSGGYYTSTSTFPNTYASIDPPSFTQSGSYSGYVGSPPTWPTYANSGSSYYGAPAAGSSSAQPVSPQGYQAPGTFTLSYNNGSQVDGANLADDVGDGVALKVSNPSKPIKSITWTVSGADQAISANLDSGTTETPLKSPQTNGPVSNFQGTQAGYFGFLWNARPATNTIKATTNFADGTTASKSFTVKVNAPKLVSFTRTYQPMGLTTVKDDSQGNQGNPVVGLSQASTSNFGGITTAGNVFKAQVDGSQLAVGGRIFMQQTLTDQVTYLFNKPETENGVTGTTYIYSNTVAIKNSQGQVTGYKLTPGVSMLDATLAYTNRYAAAPAGKLSDLWSASDSPAVVLGAGSPAGFASNPQGYFVWDTNRQASFVSTLMYQATGGAPVPVANINWSISGRATLKSNAIGPKSYYQSPSSWVLSSQTPTAGGTDQGTPTTTFPTWTGSTGTTYQAVLQQTIRPR